MAANLKHLKYLFKGQNIICYVGCVICFPDSVFVCVDDFMNHAQLSEYRLLLPCSNAANF